MHRICSHHICPNSVSPLKIRGSLKNAWIKFRESPKNPWVKFRGSLKNPWIKFRGSNSVSPLKIRGENVFKIWNISLKHGIFLKFDILSKLN